MKKNITIFVSYARANRDLATRFLRKFREQAAPSKQYHYTFWRDNDILSAKNGMKKFKTP